MNLKSDLGFRFWLRLHLLYVWPGLSRFKRQSRLAKCPEFHFSEIFKINSSLMMHCYEIIPSWKAWLCFNLWLGGATLFDCGRKHFSTVCNWRGAEVRVGPPGKLNARNRPPLTDFMNCRIWKCFYKFWKSVGLDVLNTERVQCLAY